MTSYVFTVLEKKYHWEKVFATLFEKYGKNFEMIVAIKKSNPEKEYLITFAENQKRVIVLETDDNVSENKMVSESIKLASGYDLVLCRDYFDYKTIFSDYMVAMGSQGAQIVLLRKVKKVSKTKDYFSKLYNKLVNKIFGFKLYGAEVGLSYFNNIALSTLKALPNNVLLTKVNKWAGFEISYIDIDETEISGSKLEKTENKPVITRLVVYSIVSALLIAGFVLLAVFNKLTFIIGLLFVFVFILVQFVLFYNALKYTIINKYGNLRV